MTSGSRVAKVPAADVGGPAARRRRRQTMAPSAEVFGLGNSALGFGRYAGLSDINIGWVGSSEQQVQSTVSDRAVWLSKLLYNPYNHTYIGNYKNKKQSLYKTQIKKKSLYTQWEKHVHNIFF